MTSAAKTMMLTRANLEKLIYRWNGVKAFSGNGYYFLSNKTVDASTRALPLYLFDICAVNNYQSGTLLRPTPFLQLQQDTSGSMAFAPIGCVGPDGAATTTFLVAENSTTTGAGTGLTAPAPYSKSVLESVSVRMNCWGATSKATKYTISVVRFTDDDLVPTHGTYAADLAAATNKRTDLFQSIIKPLTFNPIASTGGAFNRRMKVIKTMSFTVEPNPTTDGDSDPQVKVVSWQLKLNKLLNFVEKSDTLTTIADTNDQADYAPNNGQQIKAQVQPVSRMYLMIRASNYGLDATESNVLTPSFDLSLKLSHSVTQ